jgi:transposase-like protein
MYLRVLQGFKDIISDLHPDVSFLPNYLTDAEHAERTALVSVFPEADTLMCYFHVIKASKDKLSGNKHRDAMLKDITSLCMSLSQQEFDCKWTTVFNHWMVTSTEFALYFQKQWVEGWFNKWNIF